MSQPTANDSAAGSALFRLLQSRGLVSEADLSIAAQEAQSAGKPLMKVLQSRGLVTDEQLVSVLAEALKLPYVNLSDQEVDLTAATRVGENLSRRYNLIGVGYEPDGTIQVAMSDPRNVIAVDDLRSALGGQVVIKMATSSGVKAAIERLFAADVDNALDGLGDDDGDEAIPDDLAELSGEDEAPLVRFVNNLIQQAASKGVSDIHIEAGEKVMRVRYRTDGVLHDVTTQPRKVHAGVVSRLKIMADMDIAERRKPQDGRISGKFGSKSVDLRVSTLPTVHGEKVVMRILDKSSIMLSLTDLGFTEENFARYEQNYTKPYGMILVTGPTGSGKSTTLYATLNVLNEPGVNIVTTEDPVEYRLPGINQVQINKKAGLTFPAALASILRQDPDIVLVGEMRDQETAHIGMEAALTGHLVLSTLHTNDAPSAVTRLTEMGIDPFLVASAVDCVLAQRLARRLCKDCKKPYTPEHSMLETAGMLHLLPEGAEAGDLTMYSAIGCRKCANTGYKGRLAIHEVLAVTEQIEKLVVSGGSTDAIADLAREQGMKTLREDGLLKILDGATTFEELARVVA